MKKTFRFTIVDSTTKNQKKRWVAAAALSKPNIFFQNILINIASHSRKVETFEMCRHSLGYVSNAVQENNMTNRQQCSASAGWLVSLSQIEYA
jgi:hypothetical protein